MSAFKPEQQRLELGGRTLHFVAYEGHPAHAGRGEPAEPPMWYLMCEGRRRPVMLHEPGQPAAERDQALLQWARQHLLAAPAPRQARSRRLRQDVE